MSLAMNGSASGVPKCWHFPRSRKAYFHRSTGAVAQPGERLLCKQEVGSSILLGSTIDSNENFTSGEIRSRLVL